jgi:hypothetical protein
VQERAFRLDFFVAIAALLFSAVTAAALIYQTHVVSEQYAATIWPYLSMNSTYGFHGETFELANDGVGPALIRSAQLSVDGKHAQSWYGYTLVLAHDPKLRVLFQRLQTQYLAGKKPSAQIAMASLGPGDTLRAGESERLFSLSENALPMTVVLKHQVTIDVCYCSLNGSCWMLHGIADRGNNPPEAVNRCTSTAAILTSPV